ncbi:MAG TPA: family 1 glycosylhydrolase, partial [Terriglobales bacterium]|nr:family 1 glycosylhydrolase [Terriglobales bacterium]
LGIRALRYPVLWEQVAPDGLGRAEWSWADERLGRLRELGVRPIVGLVHHGSGPRHTSLLDPGFADGLAEFAAAVAARYPWVEDFTPVNEPLTTARFSCLYGHWYPHLRDRRAFVAALLTQVRAIALAMRAIRAVTPTARLIQTEDVGRTFSTGALAEQAAHEGDRRWLSLDLLCGRIDPAHPRWRELEAAGAPETALAALAEPPMTPDVIGVNYYVTSDRFLDERLDGYPAWAHGGNGRVAYADVEAFRAAACADPALGWRARLEELWQRYRRPVAITEAHLGGGREEQLRWLAAAWRAAHEARAAGADVRAVTAWSLLGAFDWNRLATCDDGFYESGIFDVRGAAPRPTALARMVQGLATEATWRHPVLETPGWWERPECRRYGIGPRATGSGAPSTAPPIVITGATGTLGRAFARVCEERGLAFRLLRRAELDIADPDSVARALDALHPWALVNTAGYVRVDEAEADAARCLRENAAGAAVLAAACAGRGLALATFSSDLVFDGAASRPYIESDAPAPLCVYGASKLEAEREVLAAHPGALVARTSAFFGPWDRYNFLYAVAATLRDGRVFRAPADAVVSPTYVPDLVHATLDLLVDGERGVWHLANVGAVSWADFARLGAVRCGLDPARVEDCETSALGFAAKRPRYSVLDSERGRLLPSLDDAIARFTLAAED